MEKTGFRSWKKARGKDGDIPKDKGSQYHKFAMSAWADYELNKKKNSSVEQVMNEQHQKIVRENRHYIKTIGEVILTTVTQNIAQRGCREGDGVNNPGNVREFLKPIAKLTLW